MSPILPESVEIYLNILSGNRSQFPLGFWKSEHSKERVKEIIKYVIEEILEENIYEQRVIFNGQFVREHKLRSMIKNVFNGSKSATLSYVYPNLTSQQIINICGKIKNGDDLKNENYLNQLLECYHENGNYISIPVYKKSKRRPQVDYFIKRYGTWNKALEKAGINTDNKFNKKLTKDKVIEIRKIANSDKKITFKQLSEKYGIHETHIGDIIKGKYWTDV